MVCMLGRGGLTGRIRGVDAKAAKEREGRKGKQNKRGLIVVSPLFDGGLQQALIAT
jgi:hypothetical protein